MPSEWYRTLRQVPRRLNPLTRKARAVGGVPGRKCRSDPRVHAEEDWDGESNRHTSCKSTLDSLR